MSNNLTITAPHSLQVRPDSGALSLSQADGQVRSSSVQKLTAADIRATSGQQAGTPVLNTVRTVGSGGRPAVVGPDHIVTVEGMDMTVKTATAMGYLRITESGSYAEGTTEGATQGAPEASPETGEAEAVPFEAASEEALTQFASAIPPALQDRIVGSVLSGQEVDPQIAAAAGMSPEQFSQSVEQAHAAFVEQASQEISKLGVDPAEFAEWAEQHQGEDFTAAKRQHVYGRDPKAYAKLVDKYLRTVPPTHEALARGGYTVTTTREGIDMITINGQTLSVATAARMGWI